MREREFVLSRREPGCVPDDGWPVVLARILDWYLLGRAARPDS
jgi:hypothetical protein